MPHEQNRFMIIGRYFAARHRCFSVLTSDKNNKEAWKMADALVFVNGEPDEEIIYKKSTALQSWMFGMEMQDTVIVITESSILILTTFETGWLHVHFVLAVIMLICAISPKVTVCKDHKGGRASRSGRPPSSRTRR